MSEQELAQTENRASRKSSKTCSLQEVRQAEEKKKEETSSQVSKSTIEDSEPSGTEGKIQISQNLNLVPGKEMMGFDAFGNTTREEEVLYRSKADISISDNIKDDSLTKIIQGTLKQHLLHYEDSKVYGSSKNISNWKIVNKRMKMIILNILTRDLPKLENDFKNSSQLKELIKKGFFVDTMSVSSQLLKSIQGIPKGPDSPVAQKINFKKELKDKSVEEQILFVQKILLQEKYSVFPQLKEAFSLPILIKSTRMLRNSIPKVAIQESVGSLGSFLRFLFLSFCDCLKYLKQDYLLEFTKIFHSSDQEVAKNEHVKDYAPCIKISDLFSMIEIDSDTVSKNQKVKLNKYLEIYNKQVIEILDSREIQNLRESYPSVVADKLHQESNQGRNCQRDHQQEDCEEDSDKNEEVTKFLSDITEEKSYSQNQIYINTVSDIGTYEVPSINQYKISVNKKQRAELEAIFYTGEEILPYMGVDHISRRKLRIQYKFKPHEQREFDEVYQSTDRIAKIQYGAKLKRRIKKERLKELEDTYRQDFRELESNIIPQTEMAEAVKAFPKCFVNYNWESENDLFSIARKEEAKSEAGKQIYAHLYEPIEGAKVSLSAQKFLSCAYGTCGLLADNHISQNWSNSQRLAYLTSRHRSLKHLISFGRIKNSTQMNCFQHFKKFMEHLRKTSELDIKGNKIIGFQTKDTLSIVDIAEFPLEAAFQCDSTIGRLYIVRSTDMISSHPNIIRQTSLESVYGLASNMKVETFEKNQCNFRKLNAQDQEIKLHLMKLVRGSICRVVSILEPYLSYKALIEKDVRKIQASKHCFEEVKEIKETELYNYLVILMGYLGFLKIPFIDFEKLFRVRIFCTRHFALKRNQKIKMPCLCLYGLDLGSIKRGLKNGTERKYMRNEHIRRFFQWNTEKSEYNIKSEYQQIYQEYYENRYVSQNESENLELSFNAKIQIIK